MRIILRPLFVAVSLVGLISCAPRSNREEGSPDQPDGTAQGKATEIQQEIPIIRTEEELSALLKSMLDTEKRTVFLIGRLDLEMIPKKKAQLLVIGKMSIPFGHSVDKVKFHNKTVLVRADVCGDRFVPEEDQKRGYLSAHQRGGFWILNVQHIEIIEKP